MGFLPLPTCWGRAPSNMASSISEHWNCTSKLIEIVDTIAIVTYIYILVGGFNPSEKYDFVSWDYEIPNWMEK
jgi:hypothetical protein